jgi:hypothetical protein
MRNHVELVVMGSEDEIEVDRHFRDVKKLANFMLITLIA